MTWHLYGIKNCDSCRRARRWLDETGISFSFVDVREDGIEDDRLQRWRRVLGDDALLNKRSKTWRELDESQRETARDDAFSTLKAHPTLIKRPILETPNTLIVGFSGDRYQTALDASL